MKALTKDTIDRYVKYGIPTGHFLEAVLSNRLMEAIGRADEENLRDIKEICLYVYNDIPSSCWGSPQKYLDWIDKGGQEGRK